MALDRQSDGATVGRVGARMSGTLLFSTNIREDYATVADFAAAVNAGTHPAGFDPSSSVEEDAWELDDVNTYLGVGTIRLHEYVYFDFLPGGPIIDIWTRTILRHSPTLTFGGDGRFGNDLVLYDDNVNYAAGLEWSPQRAGSVAVGLPTGNVPDGSIPISSLLGIWKKLIIHTVRSGDSATITTWWDRIPFSRHVVDLTGYPAFTNLETDWTPGGNPDPDNNYLNLARYEAYAGGDPYGLLASPRSTARRNARRLALGLL